MRIWHFTDDLANEILTRLQQDSCTSGARVNHQSRGSSAVNEPVTLNELPNRRATTKNTKFWNAQAGYSSVVFERCPDELGRLWGRVARP